MVSTITTEQRGASTGRPTPRKRPVARSDSELSSWRQDAARIVGRGVRWRESGERETYWVESGDGVEEHEGMVSTRGEAQGPKEERFKIVPVGRARAARARVPSFALLFPFVFHPRKEDKACPTLLSRPRTTRDTMYYYFVSFVPLTKWVSSPITPITPINPPTYFLIEPHTLFCPPLLGPSVPSVFRNSLTPITSPAIPSSK